MDGTFDQLLHDFIDDAFAHLDAVESSLLLFERQVAQHACDAGLLNPLLGSLHTLKGNAGMMGLSELQRYVHTLEGVFNRIVDGSTPPAPGLLEILFGAVNSMREALRSLASEGADSLDLTDELILLDAVLSGDEPFAGELPAVAQVEDPAALPASFGVVKVGFERLDDLLNLVGELVIQRTALLEVNRKLRGVVKDRALLEALNESTEQIGKTAAHLRDAIMKVRMLPVATVFNRFGRLVRDLSRRHGKEIDLLLEGGETELDKTVMDQIGELLLHLIRNAVDHGIEPPAERLSSGKPAAGVVKLAAAHHNNHIVIRVEDDGRGISIPRLKEAAQRKGLLDPRQAASLSDRDALQLLFAPGFSTSSQVTETSGRGIGLDVVRKKVLSLNGTIEVDSTPGKGTSFTLNLPLTLAIISALLVETSGETFAIPLSAVLESVQLTGTEIHELPAGQVARLRDGIIPVIRLQRQLGLVEEGGGDCGYLVVVGTPQKRGGIVVQRLVGQQEIVIRGMDDYLGDLPGISGATVLGSGKVALILDIHALLQRRG